MTRYRNDDKHVSDMESHQNMLTEKYASGGNVCIERGTTLTICKSQAEMNMLLI